MLNNDLSNRGGSTIAFRFEDFLAVQESKLFQSLRKPTYTFNEQVLGVMGFIYRNTEYSIDIVIEDINYNPHLKAALDELPFNRITLIHKPVEITNYLLSGVYHYYVDDNETRRAQINSSYAIGLQTCSELVRGQRV